MKEIIKLLVLIPILFLIIGCKEKEKDIAEKVADGFLKYINSQSDERYEKCGRGAVCEDKNGEKKLVCKECETKCIAKVENGKWSVIYPPENPNDPKTIQTRHECEDDNSTETLTHWIDKEGGILYGNVASGKVTYAMSLKKIHTYAEEGRTKTKADSEGKDPEKITVRKDTYNNTVFIVEKGKVNILNDIINYKGELFYTAQPTYSICQYEDGLKCGESTLVNLKDFTALNKSDSIYLTWATTLEKDSAGFHIWRSEKEDSGYIKITNDLIPSKGNDSQYTFIDKNVNSDNTYYYKLEDIAFCGKSTFRYPISSSSSKVFLIKPTTDIVVSSEQVPPKFEWEKGNYSKFKLQFSDDNGQTLYEIPNEWIKGTSMTPPSIIWKNFAEEKKGQTFSWRVVGENEQGQSFFSEMHHLTIR